MKPIEEKISWYIRTCWDQYRCADKEEVQRIIKEIITENPNETNYVKLGMLAKRRCIGEL